MRIAGFFILSLIIFVSSSFACFADDGYLYDEDGNIIGRTVPAVPAPVFEYDQWGNVIRFGYADNPGVYRTFEYDESGRLLSESFLNGSIRTYGYNADGKIVRMTETWSDGITLEYQYELDAHGNPVRRICSDGTVHIYVNTYDEQGRLTCIAYLHKFLPATRYEYREDGSYLEINLNGGTPEYRPDGSLYRIYSPNDSRSYMEFDEQGRMILFIGGDGRITSEYRYELHENGALFREWQFIPDYSDAGSTVSVTVYEYDAEGYLVRSYEHEITGHDGSWMSETELSLDSFPIILEYSRLGGVIREKRHGVELEYWENGLLK